MSAPTGLSTDTAKHGRPQAMRQANRSLNCTEESEDQSLIETSSFKSHITCSELSTTFQTETTTTSVIRRDRYLPTTHLRERLHTRFTRRLLWGKGVFLVLILNVLLTLAFFQQDGTVYRFIFGEAFYTSTTGSCVVLIMNRAVSKISYPIGGFLGDVYFGRHKTIRASVWFLWCAIAVLAISVALDTLHFPPLIARYLLPITTIVLISIGFGGIQANLIPFGVDQLEGVPSDKVSSYFYWYYWCTNFGILLGLVCTYGIRALLPEVINCILILLTAVIAITIVLILHVILQDWFEIDNQTYNPLKLIINVLWQAATIKRSQSQQIRSAFRYGEPHPPKRIDTVKAEYNGPYSYEEVENVKTFCLVLLVIYSLGGYDLVYNGLIAMLEFQTKTLKIDLEAVNVTSHTESAGYFLEKLVLLVNVSTIIVFIPILNHLIFPIMDMYTPNMRKRIGIGLVVTLATPVTAALIEGTSTGSVSTSERPYLFVIPVVLLTISETFVYVPVLEFIYAQSPYKMKGLLVGLWFSINGGWSAVAGIIFLLTPFSQNLCTITTTGNRFLNNCIVWYYVGYVVVAIVGFVMYVIVAFLYQNRRRENVINENARISEYFSIL